MATVPRRIISDTHMWGRVWDCKFTNDHPDAGTKATIAFTVDGTTRTEVALSVDMYNLCPGRGVITRVVAEAIGGGTFDLDIVDKPFGTGVPPALTNIIYSESPITDITSKSDFGDLPYELRRELDPAKKFLPTLYAGIVPAVGGSGTYNIHVYVLSRS